MGVEIRGVEMRAGGRECEGEVGAEKRQKKGRGRWRSDGRMVEKRQRNACEAREKEPRPGGRGFGVWEGVRGLK